DVFVGSFVFGLFLVVINVVGIVGAVLSQQWVLLALALECVAIALVVFIWSRHWKRKIDEDDE
ncbi:hypothetical protein PHET_02540, partial [Paragonimus heterotremus]